MPTLTLPRLTTGGRELDLSENAFGWLRESNDLWELAEAGNVEPLQARMQTDGYLYLPGFLDRGRVLDVRAELTRRLRDAGQTDPDSPADRAVARAGVQSYMNQELIANNPALDGVLYGPQLMNFYDTLLGRPALHFDFTWMRAVSPGGHTNPHCDIVYMGRGTSEVYTAWVPFGDVPLDLGGLIILENSLSHTHIQETYGRKDIDTFCENRPKGNIAPTGALSTNPVALRARLGGRWLTAREFKAGDLLTFTMFTIHASLDNQTNQIRLSTDTRYQPADAPADSRWVGPNHTGHGEKARRGVIC